MEECWWEASTYHNCGYGAEDDFGKLSVWQRDFEVARHDHQILLLHSLILVSIVDAKAFLPTQGHLGWGVFRGWKWHLRVGWILLCRL